jgi:DNA-directed RNA polymerase subunit F
MYALPSPIETAMLIKRAGAKYDESILNPIESVGNYNSLKSRALNMGVYSADLSFASLFDQTQTSIKYMSASKKLADDLGILNAISQETIIRLENNINQKDSIMDIISETFYNSDSYLKENNQAEIAAMVLVGGWIEGLYIAVQVAKTTENNSELVERIIDQRLSLETALNYLEQYNDKDDIKSLIEELNSLKSIYDEVQISASKIEPVTDEETKVTTLKSTTETTISPEVFDRLCEKAISFRNEIIK